jgi:hypothetical protein
MHNNINSNQLSSQIYFYISSTHNDYSTSCACIPLSYILIKYMLFQKKNDGVYNFKVSLNKMLDILW